MSGEPLARPASSPLPAIPAAVQRDLVRVEERLAAELTSREPRLEEITAHLVRAGGKRVRPLVVLLVFDAAAAGEHARRDDAIEAAVALELIHSATLLHDDIIDGGETRRGRPSALQRFGLADTLVAGDFLFCRAFALCARFEADVVRWAAEACISLTEGEMLQGRLPARPRRHRRGLRRDHPAQDRRRSSPSARRRRPISPARRPPSSTAMAACGQHVGLAFQMRDDLLDVEGHPAETGKPRGIDLRDGNPSLPIVLALERDAEVAPALLHPGPRRRRRRARARPHRAQRCPADGRGARRRAARRAPSRSSDSPAAIAGPRRRCARSRSGSPIGTPDTSRLR